MSKKRYFFAAFLLFLLAGCGGKPASPAGLPVEAATVATPTAIPPSETPTPIPIHSPTASLTPSITPTPTPDTRPLPKDWAFWPEIPTASPRTIDIYLQGIKKGVTPRTFSIIGDCQSESNVFLGIYATDHYILDPKYQYLQETIGDFHSSFSHQSVAVRDGMSAPSALDPLWANTSLCKSNESPTACELRLYNPMIVFINLGTNWRPGASSDVYKGYLRQIVDLVIANGSVPILINKADNVEGDNSINLVTAQVAYEEDIPLMNFWLSADQLPDRGLDPARNNIYLTPEGWDLRSSNALRTLDAIWRALKAVSNPG